jgi:death-on-curing protein
VLDIGGLKLPTAQEILELDDMIIELTGGLPGARPDLSVHALVGRVEANLHYTDFNHIVEIAAFYAEVIAKGHVFQDGNKRTALSTMIAFMHLNGKRVV